MSKSMRKRRFTTESNIDNSGSTVMLPVNKKCRRVSASGTKDGSGDENFHQSHPLIPRSPRSLEEEDGGSGSHLLNTESESDSSLFSLVQEETWGRLHRPINYCFLRDLSSPTSKYATDFHQNKQELIRRLYKFFNRTVFESQLPTNMDISWNKRLTVTAGRTGFLTKNGERQAIIQLSDKVCDSAERLRDTMIHEMCHAACWVIDGNDECAHHQLWKDYCDMVALTHPELPPITANHTWEPHYRVMYQCSGCQSRVGRWTESLNTEQKMCSHCNSKLCLVTQT